MAAKAASVTLRFNASVATIRSGASSGGALTQIDEAIALAGETGQHWSDAFLHRLRCEILLKRDPINAAPAEEAFLTAIAVAQQQKARSFELRAALGLVRLYNSTGRTADAHTLLAPALDGFSPTAEFPEIAEAQTPSRGDDEARRVKQVVVHHRPWIVTPSVC